ncbi:MAG TPA: hypothetical protein VJ717_19490 [Gemmatimonadaceae bacterium]|nr:hypothetical protein [Gemmatimonadaceae bacterium]
MSRRFVGIAVATLVASACSSSADHVVSPSMETLQNTVAQPVVVTGSAHIEAGDGLRNFTFHAVKRPDGSVEGSYRILRTDLSTEFTVDVTCLTVVGNRAWVAGIISQSDSPGVIVGTVSYFYAIDNGEGSGATPDIVSLARINDRAGEDILFCTILPTLLPPRVVQFGDVQIR